MTLRQYSKCLLYRITWVARSLSLTRRFTIVGAVNGGATTLLRPVGKATGRVVLLCEAVKHLMTMAVVQRGSRGGTSKSSRCGRCECCLHLFKRELNYLD